MDLNDYIDFILNQRLEEPFYPRQRRLEDP